MRSLVKTETSTETRFYWWPYPFVQGEFIAGADATINGPAAYNTSPALGDRDRAFLLSVRENPPAPSE
jgi:hypothetical protein